MALSVKKSVNFLSTLSFAGLPALPEKDCLLYFLFSTYNSQVNSNITMATIRSTVRAASRASMAARFTTSIGSVQALRSFSSSATRLNVREKEVPVTTWPPPKDGRSSIPVKKQPEFEADAAENEDIYPLTQEAYNKMSPTMQKMSVHGKTIIITGGARGLGNHMARACVEAGAANLVIFDANQELGEVAVRELYEKTGLPVTFFKVDVRDEDAINAAVDRAVEMYGVPDVLVNAAGIAEYVYLLPPLPKFSG